VTSNSPFHGLIRAFLSHRIAANLLAIMLAVAGLFAVQRLNTQFFPTIEIPTITIAITWPGASPQDFSKSVFEVVEPEIRFLDGVDNVTSYAVDNSGRITIEFLDGTDMDKALSDVQQAVANVTTLPAEAERPVITRVVNYETVAYVAVSGDAPEHVIKARAREVRDALLDRGIDRVTFVGKRDEEIWIEADPNALRQIDITAREIADRVAAVSRDEPLGTLEGSTEKQLRSAGRLDRADAFGGIEIRAFDNGQKVYLRDVARLSETLAEGGVRAFRNGRPAILLDVQRALNADTLRAMRAAETTVADLKRDLPASLTVEMFDVRSKVVDQRIDMLVANALQGFALVVAILLFFLSARVAFWVAIGVPVSLLATFALMLVTGQTINAISLLALILVLGIIVDDAIVVGEQAVTYAEQGLSPHEAAEKSASRMFWPVIASTTTTQAAFWPIFLIGGTIGQVMAAIPMVVIVALCASTLECFLSLPSHLKHALEGMRRPVGPARQKLRGLFARMRGGIDAGFDWFRFSLIRPVVVACYRARYATVAAAIAGLILCIGLIAGGRVAFTFFPTPEPEVVFANLVFAPGLPEAEAVAALRAAELAAERAAAAIEAESGEKVLVMVHSVFGRSGMARGSNIGRVEIELSPGELRQTRTADFQRRWQDEYRLPPGVDRASFLGRRTGPPGFDIDVRLTGRPVEELKAISLALQEQLGAIPGVFGIADDLPFGRNEVTLALTPRGQALGFTTLEVARQVRTAYQGAVALRFMRGEEEVAVRVKQAGRQTGRAGLETLTLRAPGGAEVRLAEVVRITERPAFASVQRRDGKVAVSVTANTNSDVATPDQVRQIIRDRILPDLKASFGPFDAGFRGQADTQQRAFADLGTGALLALLFIFLILAFTLQSYSQPLLIMLMIPFGLIGAILGHWIMGFQLALLSMVGMLGLSGILVNNGIVLVDRFNERLSEGEDVETAATGASVDRVRASILTSLTTIAGMSPLLTEESLQAQFLIPIAITLSFGLGMVTVLVLMVQPALLGIAEDIRRLSAGYARAAGWRMREG
jgi:multidrug efflux pump subunit AcrB